MGPMRSLAVATAAVLLGSGCVHRPPDELVAARDAVESASAGPAKELAPADLARAEEALQAAESAYQESPRSWKAADLAYVAKRRAELAAVLAAVARTEAGAAKQREDLADRAGRLQPDAPDLGRDDERGFVITLEGEHLFDGPEASIRAEAAPRLERVAGALLTRRAQAFVVEGRGADPELARHRAEAVKAWLASRGYAAGSIDVRVGSADDGSAVVEVVVPR